MLGQLQWFFKERYGWIALIGGLGQTVIFLVFVAVNEGWGRDLRMEPIGAWAFLTLLSMIACFGVVYGTQQLVKFDTERPWYDKAQTAEKAVEDLKDKERELREAKRNLSDSLESLKQSNSAISAALAAQKQTMMATAERLSWVEPRLKAAEDWIDAQGKRIVTIMDTASVEDKHSP